MYKYVYLAVLGTLGASMFNDYIPGFGLKSVTDELIKPVSAQITRVKYEANQTIDSIDGVVVAVSDGDTLTVKTEYGNTVIRMFAIDAPEASCHGFSDSNGLHGPLCVESGQPGATASKLHLRVLTLEKKVTVRLGQGMSGKRLVGTVLADGVDVNLEMVKAGHAWHYKYFSKNQTPDDKSSYTTAENNAKFLKKGLWSVDNPIAPWIYRKQHKTM